MLPLNQKALPSCLALLLATVSSASLAQGSAQLQAPDSVLEGSTVQVQWQGPGADGDRIYLVPEGASASEWHWTYPVYPRDGNPLSIPLPLKVVPGNYQFRYVAAVSNAILATRPLTVVAVEATLDYPAEVLPDQEFEVTWTGPDGPEDFISVAEPGAHIRLPLEWTYTTEGTPLQLMAPNRLGAFVVRYQMGSSYKVVVERKLQIVEQLTLSGLTLTVTAGEPQFAGDVVAENDDAPHTTQVVAAGTMQFTGLVDQPHTTQVVEAGTMQFTGLVDQPHTTQVVEAGTMRFTGLVDEPHTTQVFEAGTLQFTGTGATEE